MFSAFCSLHCLFGAKLFFFNLVFMERTGIKVDIQKGIGKYWYSTLKIRFSIII